MDVRYRGLVANPQIGQLVWTGRGIGRIYAYDSARELFFVTFENGAKSAWFGRDRLRNP